MGDIGAFFLEGREGGREGGKEGRLGLVRQSFSNILM